MTQSFGLSDTNSDSVGFSGLRTSPAFGDAEESPTASGIAPVAGHVRLRVG